MRVVSNTSPLLNLAIIDRLDLVRQQFGKVHVPQAVIAELRLDELLPGSDRIERAIDAGWIQVQAVDDSALVQVLQRDLDWGEAETIALALQLSADRVLLDEREARQVAKSLGLETTGILGILLRAKNEGRIASLEKETDLLQNRAGFRIDRQLLESILRAGGEG
jgi:predicted nucleic acid-binding protein